MTEALIYVTAENSKVIAERSNPAGKRPVGILHSLNGWINLTNNEKPGVHDALTSSLRISVHVRSLVRHLCPCRIFRGHVASMMELQPPYHRPLRCVCKNRLIKIRINSIGVPENGTHCKDAGGFPRTQAMTDIKPSGKVLRANQKIK